MTCIVAYVDDAGNGHIGSDSLSSNSWRKDTVRNRKIFRKENFLFGYTSSWRMGQLLEYQFNLPERKPNQTLTRYMHTDFIEGVRTLLKDHGYMEIDKAKESIGTFIVVIESRIFYIQDDLSILESENKFDACGCGEDFARSAMHILDKYVKIAPRELLKEAIAVAGKYSTGVGGSFKYLAG